MAEQIDLSILIKTNADKVTASVNKLSDATNEVVGSAKKLGASFGSSIDSINAKLKTIQLTNILQQVNMVADGFSSLSKPGETFATSMKDLEAITGVTGKTLADIGDYARENAKTFGGSAAEGVESYKLILSQLNPEIAKTPEALKAMGEAVSTTSKLMGGDTAAATEVLTTAMNQYQVSTEDPIQASKEMATMMNVMAAAAKEGSAELPQIKGALENAGMSAKIANVSFAETNAAIQVLDKAGKKGAEGGIALRNVMATLSEGRFLPPQTKKELEAAGISIDRLTDKNLTLAERLKPLRAIMNDGALVTKLFGKENNSAALALISGIDEQERLTAAISGTNTAYEQAAIVMEGPAEKSARLKAQVDDFKISLFNGTGALLGYASVLGDVARDMTNLFPALQAVGTIMSVVTSKSKMMSLWTGILEVKSKAVAVAQKVWAGAQMMLNVAMSLNPVGLIIAGITAMIAIIATAITYYDDFGAALLMVLGPIGMVVGAVKSIYDHWQSITKAFKEEGIIAGMKRIGVVLLDVILKPVQQLLQLLAKIPGLGSIAGSGAKAIEDMRKGMNLVTTGETAAKEAKKAGVSGATTPDELTQQGATAGVMMQSKALSKGKDAIATGGTKNNTITITFKNMVENINVSGGSFKETTAQMEEAATDAMLRVLGMAATAGK